MPGRRRSVSLAQQFLRQLRSSRFGSGGRSFCWPPDKVSVRSWRSTAPPPSTELANTPPRVNSPGRLVVVHTTRQTKREEMYMSDGTSPDATPSDAAARIQRWATAICHVATLRSADVADALQLDLATADRLGCQRIFPPSTVDSRVEFVLGPDEETIIFLEVTPSYGLTAADLSTLLGPWREVSSGRTPTPRRCSSRTKRAARSRCGSRLGGRSSTLDQPWCFIRNPRASMLLLARQGWRMPRRAEACYGTRT